MTVKATPTAGARLLTPNDHTLILIDHQSQMAFATHSLGAIELRNNSGLVAQAAAAFKVASIVTSVAEAFLGPRVRRGHERVPRSGDHRSTTMSCWEDERITAQVNRFGRRKIVLAGLWTSVCISDPALSALDQGFEVYVITDACGDVSVEAHERAMQRMIQARAYPRSTSHEQERPMKIYLVCLAVGLLVGVIYGVLNVRSPAPPVVALIGLLGILLGEQIVPLAKRLFSSEPVTAAWAREQCGEHVFSELPGKTSAPITTKVSGIKQSA